jgi:hypothetical protein
LLAKPLSILLLLLPLLILLQSLTGESRKIRSRSRSGKKERRRFAFDG